MKIISFLAIFFTATITAHAQSADIVTELIARENYFSALVKEKGIKNAFLKVGDENTILFKPNPVNAISYFKNRANIDSGSLTWEPVFARVSKSNDWGFTSGPYIYKASDTSKSPNYGDYLSLWKRNKRGLWTLALNLGISHKKPKSVPKLVYVNPRSNRFLHQQSTSRLQQREDIVLSSDKLYATILKAENKIAFKEFLSDDIRLLFPGQEPILGKEAAMNFWQKQGLRVASQAKFVDRSYSGELALTRGEATIIRDREIKKYHYVRIWEIQPGYNWNIILEIFTPLQQSEENKELSKKR